MSLAATDAKDIHTRLGETFVLAPALVQMLFVGDHAGAAACTTSGMASFPDLIIMPPNTT